MLYLSPKNCFIHAMATGSGTIHYPGWLKGPVIDTKSLILPGKSSQVFPCKVLTLHHWGLC